MAHPKLVYIEWCDAISDSGGWKYLEEVFEWAEDLHWIVKESGFILKETKDYILLAHKMVPAKNKEENLYGSLKKIPKTWIIKKIDLTAHIDND